MFASFDLSHRYHSECTHLIPADGIFLHNYAVKMLTLFYIQSNLDSSNTDGSFTMADSNSFLSPYEFLPIAQENKYLGKFSYFVVQLYVVCTH